MLVSIIIPVLNESGLIVAFLRHLRESTPAAEIILCLFCGFIMSLYGIGLKWRIRESLVERLSHQRRRSSKINASANLPWSDGIGAVLSRPLQWNPNV